jgi:hypothetical protein
MRTTLLDIVQSILSDMDSEDVNSISDTTEAQQVASVVQDTYFNIVTSKNIPELKAVFTITSLSQLARPTYFKYPTDVKDIEQLFYNVSRTGGADYREVKWIEPEQFLARMPKDGTVITDVDGTTVSVNNDRMPTYYTSFDDEHIIMDAYDVSIEPILAENKTKAFGTRYPTFVISDTFEPDLDNVLLPYLLAEAKSACFSLFKAGSDPKIEQSARRLKSAVQNDMYKTRKSNIRNNYGR